MSNKLKKIIITLVVLILCVIVGYNYMITSGARDLTTEQSEYSISSKTLINEFTTNLEASNTKYLEKAIEVSGTISSINNLELIIDNVIICNLKNTDTTLKVGETITIKGRVVGFDDLMGELKMDECFKK